jgi:hypothetical protein
MFALRTGLRQAIAFLGMAALLLGALEHESLILQDATATPAVAETSGTLLLGLGASCHELTETGTEGTFRAEKHGYSLSPKAQGHAARAYHLSQFTSPSDVLLAAPSARYWQSRPTGIVALRL